MAYIYCRDCNTEMNEPTDEEILNDSYDCLNCGRNHNPHKTVNDVVLSLMERINALEEKMAFYEKEYPTEDEST